MRLETIRLSGVNVEVHGFDSVAEQTGWCMHPSALEHGTVERSRSNPEFTGREFKDWGAVREAANGVWDDGLRLLEEARQELIGIILPQPIDRRRRPRFDDSVGDDVDYDRLRSGQAYWRTTSRQSCTGPSDLTVLVDVAANASVSASQIIWRGVAAIVLAELLEAAGYRVEIIAYERNTGTYTDGAGMLQYVTLKQLDEQLDATTLIASTSGWFYRTIGFAGSARSVCGRVSESSLGRHVPLDRNEVRQMTPAERTAIVDGVWNKFDAVDLIRRTLATYAGE